MATKKTEEATVDDVEFVPSAEFEQAVAMADDRIWDRGLPPPEVYRELRPWTRETLIAQLNAAAADGWKLAAVVGTQIILERAR